MAGFQTQVKVQPAPAVEGEFASTNPRHTVLAGPGGLVAGETLTVGRFAWMNDAYSDPEGAPAAVLQASGYGDVAGFLHNDRTGQWSTYLQETGMTIPAGWPVTLYSSGDFWVKNSNATAVCYPGQKAYADFGTGKVKFAATGTAGTVQNTAFSIVTVTTPSATLATINGTILTIPTGSTTAGFFFYPGTILTSGGTIVAGTMILAQLSGTAGGVGQYSVNYPQVQTAATISGSYGLLTTTGTQTGAWAIGMVLTAASDALTSGTYITAMSPTGALTGVGALGTYVVTPSQAHSTGTVVGTSNVETKWIARSYGAVGELIKISNQVLA